MALYIVTGSYTAAAMKGMIAHPSDRAAAARGVIEASGGKMVSFLLTTGDYDFSMVVETGDMPKMLASLMVVGATGAVTGLKTVQAFTNDEFTAAQKAASAIAKSYAAPS
ncbi:MAG: GYD domain-containing protein [Albidovulum sp.]